MPCRPTKPPQTDCLEQLEKQRAVLQEAKLLLDSGSLQNTPGNLSPWDEMAYFNTPTSTTTTLPGDAWVQIAGPDPSRVVLMISYPTSGAGNVFIIPGTTTGVTPGTGIALTQQNTPIIITQKEYGILAQTAWFMLATLGPSTVTTVSVTMSRWTGNPTPMITSSPRQTVTPNGSPPSTVQPPPIVSTPQIVQTQSGSVPQQSGIPGIVTQPTQNQITQADQYNISQSGYSVNQTGGLVVPQTILHELVQQPTLLTQPVGTQIIGMPGDTNIVSIFQAGQQGQHQPTPIQPNTGSLIGDTTATGPQTDSTDTTFTPAQITAFAVTSEGQSPGAQGGSSE